MRTAVVAGTCMVVGRTRQSDVATVRPLLVQPDAMTDAAEVIVEIAAGASQGCAGDLAGPEPHDPVDMAFRTLARTQSRERQLA